MAAVGARPVLYHPHPAPAPAGGAPMSSSYFSRGGGSSSPASSLSAAHFDISEFLFDDAGGGGAISAGGAGSAAAPERPRTDRIAFRTRSEVEVLDDGYKWRKYGKKSVKNSPNPRNYYRCSTEGCNVKKRVERDRDDPGYVVTTYEGTHNHASPSTVYYASQDAASGRFFVAGTQPPGPGL
ncbi:putative WRKY transcription factor 50 [Zea mays]|uniref:WRKY7-superfamily of TFs having WRKY and zinc finger domains n=2 Tax=Zea mays TaxID=4577 RepID=B6T167_MAIZE|nr:WRKY7 - superfamily of TFs having WRKY and zinc finger domains [Zea mays]PWZ09871.1 putative WRKY transcription factor 50 [Zea mays]|eukprot:NP_001148337.1 WRKY7 - superfamily of TFs having WRKY and zinc finger domains [Zea mays]